jgi:hypothetical protein
MSADIAEYLSLNLNTIVFNSNNQFQYYKLIIAIDFKIKKIC